MTEQDLIGGLTGTRSWLDWLLLDIVFQRQTKQKRLEMFFNDYLIPSFWLEEAEVVPLYDWSR